MFLFHIQWDPIEIATQFSAICNPCELTWTFSHSVCRAARLHFRFALRRQRWKQVCVYCFPGSQDIHDWIFFLWCDSMENLAATSRNMLGRTQRCDLLSECAVADPLSQTNTPVRFLLVHTRHHGNGDQRQISSLSDWPIYIDTLTHGKMGWGETRLWNLNRLLSLGGVIANLEPHAGMVKTSWSLLLKWNNNYITLTKRSFRYIMN